MYENIKKNSGMEVDSLKPEQKDEIPKDEVGKFIAFRKLDE